jgi:hypothetical protein
MGMHLVGMHLTGGTAQKVGTNELDNRRVGHSDSFNISIKCRAIGERCGERLRRRCRDFPARRVQIPR